MRHGRDPVSGVPCSPKTVRLVAGGLVAWAVEGCVCGLAEVELCDVWRVGADLLDELRQDIDEGSTV